MDDLRPCPNPWCDEGIALVETREGGFFRVGCSCGVAGPPSTDEKSAIAAWNTRTMNLDAMREALVEARKLLNYYDYPTVCKQIDAVLKEQSHG